MKNTDRILPADAAIARVPAFAVTPPPRCFTAVGPSPEQKCGELATRRRRGNRWFSDTFHCPQHADSTDVPIGGEFVVRRVRVSCDVLLAGVDERQGPAQTEAVARLAAAVAAAGGVLDVKIAASQIGRYPAYSGAVGAYGVTGSPE